ncbi:MAG: arylsulfatase [Spartobacteria bacterium]
MNSPARKLLPVVLAFAAFCGWAFAEKSESKRPNVLLVITDDQGFGDAGFQGNPILKTPNLDALAASGVRFTDFLASPTCSPSRAALMTGRHEFRSRVTHTIEGRNILQAGVPTMADAFAKAGYRTGIFGKWHLGEPRPFHPLDRGFQHALLVGGGATGQTPDFWGNTMFNPHLQENGEWKPFQGYMTDIFAEEALKWIRSGNQPWFCYLPLNAPHVPLQIGDEWVKPYLYAGLPENLAKFYGMIANLDSELGQMLAELAKDGLDRETIVIFLGDNGSALGGSPRPEDFNGGLRGTKGCAYQGGVRIPAVFSWPGHFPADRTVNTLGSLYDILPTLAQACSLDLSGFPKPDGRSLLPILLAGKQPADWTDRIVPTHVGRWNSGTPEEKIGLNSSSVRNQRYSLVNGSELFDLQSDPGQKTDIAAANPEIAKSLRKAHQDWWNSVRAEALSIQPFVLGLPGQTTVDFTCMDWQPSRATNEKLSGGAWEQENLAAWQEGKKSMGSDGAIGGWLVDVKTPGKYTLELRQRPPEALEPKPFAKGEARLDIAGKIIQTDIPADTKCVRMEVELPAGEIFLEPVIDGQRPSGLPQGAYFCRVLSGDAK